MSHLRPAIAEVIAIQGTVTQTDYDGLHLYSKTKYMLP
jgi:hypothetical protein